MGSMTACRKAVGPAGDFGANAGDNFFFFFLETIVCLHDFGNTVNDSGNISKRALKTEDISQIQPTKIGSESWTFRPMKLF